MQYLGGLRSAEDTRAAVLQAAADWDAGQIRQIQAAMVKAGDPLQFDHHYRQSFVINEICCRIANQTTAGHATHPIAIMYRWAPQVLAAEWLELSPMMPGQHEGGVS